MSKVNSSRESIQISLPINAAYVSAARLTASSIANRMVFDIDEIEDVKAAVSEACTFIIKNAPPPAQGSFTIVFDISKEVLTINISAQSPLSAAGFNDEIGLVMIKALMDEMETSFSDSENFKIRMVKRHKESGFNLT